MPINMPIYYKVPDGVYRRVTSDDIVLEMFAMFKDSEYLILYIGEVNVAHLQLNNLWGVEDNPIGDNEGNAEDNPIGDNEGNAGDNPIGDNEGNAGDNEVEGNERNVGDNLVGGNEGNARDNEVDNPNMAYAIRGPAEANSSIASENASILIDIPVYGNDGKWDLKYGENAESSNPTCDLGEYAEYAEMIRDDYVSYIDKKIEGKFVDSENVADQEILEEVAMSNEEAFPKFNEDIDMDNLQIVVGLVFPNV
ncbi:hypothetical protein ACH5RR_018483 [Cinchona calisaya]|uniref:Uncharacterized protein n=1 Tax=Cinchona calisaya TaxID=153742 RepID=A0ABD2ZLJ8_9GENT